MGDGFDLAVSAQAFDRSLAKRVRLNRAILTNKYWLLPVDDKGHENFMPVGRGDKSSEFCGKWKSFVVCKNVEEHKGIVVNGVDCTGKVVVRHKHMWCHKPTCPVCFIRGWAVRASRSIESRLDEGVNRDFGKVEHIFVSVSPKDYDLDEKVFRKKCRTALKVRGVIGGCMTFHGYRIDRKRGVLVWSPHYHTLGFIKGGYAKCRNCKRKWNCLKGCGGFDDTSYQSFLKDGYYVKVFDERKTVFGTAWYNLNHATVKVSFLSRFHTVTWFGICGNRKYASVQLKSKDECPACSGDMERHVYVGNRLICRNIGDVNYKSWFVDDEFDEHGEPNYVEVVGSRGYG